MVAFKTKQQTEGERDEEVKEKELQKKVRKNFTNLYFVEQIRW